MTVDDSREFTIPWAGGVVETWWDRFLAWWNSLQTWQKAAVIATGGVGGIGGAYAATRKPKAKKP